MDNLLENYLEYLNEKDVLFDKWISNSKLGKSKFASTALGKPLVGSLGTTLNWGIFYIPATILAWKAAKALFSSAVRKCGGIRSNTPGFKVCVSKERIKALQQRMTISKKMLSGCGKAKDPELCKQRFQLDIEKCNNRIQIEKGKIQETIGEGISGIAKVAGSAASGVGGIALMFAAGSVLDKALFLSLRTAQSLFSSATRKCGVYKQGSERELCVSKIKLNSLTKQLAIYQRLLVNCSKKRNPEECKNKMTGRIEKINREIEIQKNNILGYNKEIETAKRESEFKEQMKRQKI